MSLTADLRYRVEVSPPKQKADNLKIRLERFASKYNQIVEAGHCACITDNAMGHLAFGGHELIKELGLQVRPGQVMVHLNTFHSLRDLHWILDSCAELGIDELLIISGDGSVRLPKLKPTEVGEISASVTAVELLTYIRKNYDNQFKLGVAFNQYEPEAHELYKLKCKIDAGIDFVITQPTVGRNALIDKITHELNVPVIVEAWMSPKLNLLSECIGYELGDTEDFDPVKSLKELQDIYSGNGFYLALLNLKTQFDLLKTVREA